MQLNNNITSTVTDLNKTQSTEGLGFVCLFLCLFFLPTAIKEGLEEVTFELAHEEDTGV